jgi:hypothetical protein
MTPMERLVAATRALIRHLRDPEIDGLAVLGAVHGHGFSPEFSKRGQAIVTEAEAAIAALEEQDTAD